MGVVLGRTSMAEFVMPGLARKLHRPAAHALPGMGLAEGAPPHVCHANQFGKRRRVASEIYIRLGALVLVKMMLAETQPLIIGPWLYSLSRRLPM